MASFSITYPTTASDKLDYRLAWGYPKADGSTPSDAEVVERARQEALAYLKQRIRNAKEAAAIAALTAPDLT